MSIDQSAAIYIYSMRKYKQSVYYHLKKALDSNDRREVIPWFPYLKLFFSAVKLLEVCEMEIWQGIPYAEDHEDLFNSSTAPLFTCIGSCTPIQDVATMYASDHCGSASGETKIIIIGYQGVKAYDISDYIEGYHKEVFLPHGINTNRIRTVKDKKGALVVHLSCTYPRDSRSNVECHRKGRSR